MFVLTKFDCGDLRLIGKLMTWTKFDLEEGPTRAGGYFSHPSSSRENRSLDRNAVRRGLFAMDQQYKSATGRNWSQPDLHPTRSAASGLLSGRRLPQPRPEEHERPQPQHQQRTYSEIFLGLKSPEFEILQPPILLLICRSGDSSSEDNRWCTTYGSRSQITRHSRIRTRPKHDENTTRSSGNNAESIPRLRPTEWGYMHAWDGRRSRKGCEEIAGSAGRDSDGCHERPDSIFPAEWCCRNSSAQAERYPREIHRRVWQYRGSTSMDVTVKSSCHIQFDGGLRHAAIFGCGNFILVVQGCFQVVRNVPKWSRRMV